MSTKTLLQFNSPTRGQIDFANVIYDLVNFMEEDSKAKHRLIIGTDSRANHLSDGGAKNVEFITAIVIHRLGKGARYFWRRETKEKIHTLRQKIYEEAGFSLAAAQQLIGGLNKYLSNTDGNPGLKSPEYELEIHIDIGENGPTREMIKEIVGMIQGSGFNAKTKPYSYGASTVADKHT
ncbi:MAG: ribonuclease H-like YkuK family protein [Candidatus Portnoybacteria bacterium]|nr:ribonuclease H-like YkuK family protein [Candidatus Portnoybacteria bacterium]